MEKPNEIAIPTEIDSPELFNNVCAIIDQARRHIATYANVEAVISKWRIGKRIKEDVLFNKRAEYGKQILLNLSIMLTEKYGKGWGLKSLHHCLRAAYTFSEEEIAYALRIQLTWPHIRSLMFMEKSWPTGCKGLLPLHVSILHTPLHPRRTPNVQN